MPDEQTAGWQPIETAPRDGRRIIVWVSDEPQNVCSARWTPHGWLGGAYDFTVVRPLWWMPLPEVLYA